MPWQLIQSALSFMENLGCNTNHAGDYCLAVTYNLFVEQLAIPPGRPELLFAPNAIAARSPDDDDLAVQFTTLQCLEIRSLAGCCIGSLLNVRVPAGFEFFTFRAAVLVTELPLQCLTLGVNVSTAPCPLSQVDTCTQVLDGLPRDCQAFALSFPLLVS